MEGLYSDNGLPMSEAPLHQWLLRVWEEVEWKLRTQNFWVSIISLALLAVWLWVGSFCSFSLCLSFLICTRGVVKSQWSSLCKVLTECPEESVLGVDITVAQPTLLLPLPDTWKIALPTSIPFDVELTKYQFGPMTFEQKWQVSLMNWGCENPVQNSLVLPSGSNQEGHILQMGTVWMLEDLLAVWLSHCMEITHLEELLASAMNVVWAETNVSYVKTGDFGATYCFIRVQTLLTNTVFNNY